MRRARVLLLIVTLLGSTWNLALPAPGEPAPPAAPTPAPSWLARHRTGLIWGAGLTSVTCGILAYAARRSANRHFDAYAQSADPVRITAEYEATTRRDHRAAGLFIVSEATFVVAIYLGFFVERAASYGARTESDERRAPPACGPLPALRLSPGEVALCWRW